jgi:hypothetical protein
VIACGDYVCARFKEQLRGGRRNAVAIGGILAVDNYQALSDFKLVLEIRQKTAKLFAGFLSDNIAYK